jgi:DnaK suppressor protein
MKASDLQFFKNMLLERKAQVLRNIDGANHEMNTLDLAGARDEADLANLNVSTVIDQALNVKQSKELIDIDYALLKFDAGTYGICEMCEEEISMQRLKVKPHARYCIVCREIVEKERNNKRSF